MRYIIYLLCEGMLDAVWDDDNYDTWRASIDYFCQGADLRLIATFSYHGVAGAILAGQ